jgi:hypothetical protein
MDFGTVEDLTDHNLFDEYAAGRGGWNYDNGWGPNWPSSYMGRIFRIRKTAGNESLADYLLLLRRDKTGEAEVWHFGGHDKPAKVQVWSGTLNSKSAFEAMMATVDTYSRTYQEQLTTAGNPLLVVPTRGAR